MKRYLIALMVVCICLIACTSQENGVEPSGEDTIAGVQFQKISLEEALALAQNQNKIILVDFFSPT